MPAQEGGLRGLQYLSYLVASAIGPIGRRTRSTFLTPNASLSAPSKPAAIDGPAGANALARGEPSFLDFREFANISEGARQSLAQSLGRRTCGPNEFIYLQDDEADYLYFIRSGHVRLSYLLEDGSPILFGILPPGESFGEVGVFEGGTHCDMATAVGHVVIASIPARTFRTLAQRYPELEAALGRVVARRYRAYVGLTRSLGLRTLHARLSQTLLRLADGLRTRTMYHGREVPFIGAFVTQTDLGLMARGARGNVNRAIKAWERAGWLATQDRCILILNRSQLETVAIEEGIK